MDLPSPRAAWRRARAVREAQHRGEEGFILLESVVAIGLISLLMGALASFTITAVTATTELRARQGAVQVAGSATATVAALPGSDLVRGRDAASVANQVKPETLRAQFGSKAGQVQAELSAMTPVSDPAAASGAGATATLPTSPPTPATQLNGVSYRVSTYLGSCVMETGTSGGCGTGGSGATQLRVVVAVAWANRACGAGDCVYTTSTLVNSAADPVFNSNRAKPPVPPVVDGPGDQVSTLGTAQSLQLAVVNGTGLAPHTWQVTTGTLPTGLSMSAGGLITGTPRTLSAATPLTVTVSDVFGRTGTSTFTWRVVGPPTITTPASQSTPRGSAVTVPVAGTCPNGPCRWSAAGLPAGLAIDTDTGVISGSPTTVGSASVTVTTTDADGATATTAPFSWTITDPVAVSSPGTLSATVGTTVNVPVTYTCTSGPCTITLTGTVPGVGLSATGPLAANNVTTSLAVPSGTGRVFLTGTVQPTAVPTGSTSRVFTPGLRIAGASSSATSAPGTWTVFARPGLAPIANRTVTVGTTKNVGVDYTCPSVPCTLTLTATVPGIGLSTTAGATGPLTTTSVATSSTTGTVYLAGLVDDSAAPSGSARAWPVSLTISDSAGAGTTASGTWTSSTAPRITNPGSQAAQPGQDVSLQLSAACPNGGCSWNAEVQVNGSGPWIPVAISGTGRLSYAAVPAGTYSVRVRVSDADGASDTTTFPLTVAPFTLSVPNLVSSRPILGTRTITFDAKPYLAPAADGYTWSLGSAPSWLSISPDGVLTATITFFSRTATGISVVATSTASPTSRVVDTFTWTLQ